MSKQLDRLFTNYPFEKLTDFQQEALSFILAKLADSTIQDLRQQAYTVATIKHETGDTYRPIKEYGSEQYLRSKAYFPFVGRGYCQITWKDNYKRFGDLLKIDLLTKPELALDPDVSWRITELGMTKGLFTGKKLDDYFNNEVSNWIQARRIINRLDRAALIADYATRIYEVITVIDDIPEPRGFDEGGQPS